MDPNPYESPKSPKPVATRWVAKRAIGAVTILPLTPLAVLIALGCSCAATYTFLDNTTAFGNDYGTIAIIGFSIFLIPPAVVLIGMIWWAVRARRQEKDK